MSITLTSTAFKEGEAIPTAYTGDGRNVSPPLTWSDPPAGTKSFALICQDPDAPRGTFTHWVLFNLPADARELGEAAHPAGAAEGTNDFSKAGYGGPAPPPGKPHRYYFELYALDATLPLRPGSKKQALLDAIRGHVLGEGRLMGTYGRQHC
jgi:Raf kinase inhibitor-like YbhB/YbcL family protein